MKDDFVRKQTDSGLNRKPQSYLSDVPGLPGFNLRTIVMKNAQKILQNG